MSHTLRRHGATLDILLQSHAPCSTCHHLVRSSCALDELCFVETQSVVIVGVQPCVASARRAAHFHQAMFWSSLGQCETIVIEGFVQTMSTLCIAGAVDHCRSYRKGYACVLLWWRRRCCSESKTAERVFQPLLDRLSASSRNWLNSLLCMK